MPCRMALVQSPEPLEPLALMQIPADVLVRQVRDHAMFLIDRQGRVATWNEGVREVLGWESGASGLRRPIARWPQG